MQNATLFVQMVLVFSASPILFNYFIYVVQKQTTGFLSDMKWWLIFSLPLIFMHTLISQTWHMSAQAKISPWVTSIIATICGTAGTALVLYKCYDDTPSIGKVIGFSIMVAGGLIAAYWR